MQDKIYMRRCVELAKKAVGKTYPNPMVGAVIVHNGKIIGEGYHQKAGMPHAEINAIDSVQDKTLLKDSTIYVSLEPCAHFGKTPPCALKLKEIGFRKVVIGTLDSHEKVNGKGKKILEDSGMAVVSGVLENECRELNKRFFTFHQNKRPYIILKWAESEDGFLDKDFKKEYLEIVANIHSEEYYVKMVIAWFFATALTKQWDYAVIYLENNKLDVWVHNKTIQKARESLRILEDKKGYLKRLKRKKEGELI